MTGNFSYDGFGDADTTFVLFCALAALIPALICAFREMEHCRVRWTEPKTAEERLNKSLRAKQEAPRERAPPSN